MTLKTYLQERFTSISSQLSWADSDYEVVVEDALELYAVDSENLATDTNKLHKLGKLAFWSKVLDTVSLDYSFSADGAKYDRNQMFEMANKKFEQAFSEAIPYLASYTIETGTISIEHDPYIDYPEYSERKL